MVTYQQILHLDPLDDRFFQPAFSILWLPVEDIAPQPIVKEVLLFLLLFLWLHVEELTS